MTTEIAVMNKSGISLAADSAVTIGGGNKFYNTANKLFMLSKYNPIGIMVYSNADFMGYPIEIVIKEYRKKLGDTVFDSLFDYWDDFVIYIEKNFSDNNGMDDYLYKIGTFIYTLDNNIKEYTNDKIEDYYESRKISKGTIEKNQEEMLKIASECVKEVISDVYERYCSLNDDDKFIESFDLIKSSIKENVENYINDMIGEIDEIDRKKILDICTMILTKKHNFGTTTGIVIAGFGEKDMFPKLINGDFMGVYFNKLKYKEASRKQIDHDNEASIIPFAQDDVINTFMTGIDQELKIGILETIEEYKLHTCEDKKCIEKLKDDVNKKIDKWSQENHVNPIMETVSIAPKEELAQMTETLINLTSFRKNLSIDIFGQSVGGPIDVALITKGDGFIWIKRKHYFDVNKNHHFVENYFNRRD